MEKQTREGEERRMKTLIVGADSLLGRYMFDYLSHIEAETVFPAASSGNCVDSFEPITVEDEDGVRSLIERTEPDRIFYFTDQESISYAWEYPDKVVDAQIKGRAELYLSDPVTNTAESDLTRYLSRKHIRSFRRACIPSPRSGRR